MYCIRLSYNTIPGVLLVTTGESGLIKKPETGIERHKMSSARVEATYTELHHSLTLATTESRPEP